MIRHWSCPDKRTDQQGQFPTFAPPQSTSIPLFPHLWAFPELSHYKFCMHTPTLPSKQLRSCLTLSHKPPPKSHTKLLFPMTAMSLCCRHLQDLIPCILYISHVLTVLPYRKGRRAPRDRQVCISLPGKGCCAAAALSLHPCLAPVASSLGTRLALGAFVADTGRAPFF